MARSTATRRQFLGVTGFLSMAAVARAVGADELPPVTDPRATSGDAAHEPDWDQRLSISVGPDNADLVGLNDKAIQAAVDYVSRLGGGTVRLLAGTYRMRGAVHLRSRVRIVGSGPETVLMKNPSTTTTLAADSDWYDQEITLADAHGFEVGDGVCLQTRNPHHGGQDVLKRILVARSGNRFKLDRPLGKNFWVSAGPTVSTLFPLLEGAENCDVVIEDLALDGNRAENENLDGNYGGCIFLQDCGRYTIRRVTARNYNGDGISWQVCHDVVVESCHSHDNAGLGLHPGSGSQRPLIRNNRIERNRLGLFFCWGVKFGLAEGNRIDDNRTSGISLGHRDTDNLIRNNVIQRSGQVGILFRDESQAQDSWAHRNRLEGNQIVDSGSERGIAIDVQGKTAGVVIRGNQLRETRGPMQRTGVRLGSETRDITLDENRVDGFSKAVLDQRGQG